MSCDKKFVRTGIILMSMIIRLSLVIHSHEI